MKKGNETICALLDKVMRQQREIDNYKEQISLLEKQNSGMLNDYLVKKDKNDFLTKENAELHREVEKLKEENKKLKERLEASEKGVPYAEYVARKRYAEAWDKMADKVLKGTGLYDSMLKAMDLLKSENERLANENRFYKMKYSGKHCCLSLGCPFLMREDDE